jgi:hypothetical protein
MKATRARLALSALCLLLVASGRAPAQQEAAAPPVAAGDEVAMAEVVLNGTTARGRIAYEDDETIRIETVAGSVIGYRKDRVTELNRFTLHPSTYHELRGDHQHERAAELPDPFAALTRARQAYQRALAHAPSEKDRSRIQAKLQGVAAEREEIHNESLRQEEVARAREETELARIERQLTEEKLEALKRQEGDIRRLARQVTDLAHELEAIKDSVNRLERRIEDLDDDLDRLDRFDRIFIRQSVFVDLQREHERLEREVERLRREVERD